MTPRLIAVTLLFNCCTVGCATRNPSEIGQNRGIVLSLLHIYEGALVGNMSAVGAPEDTVRLPIIRYAGILQNNSNEEVVVYDEFCFEGWGALSIQIERKNRLIDISRVNWPGPSSIAGRATIGPGESFFLPVPLIPSLWDENISLLHDSQPGDRMRIKLELRFVDGRASEVIKSNFILVTRPVSPMKLPVGLPPDFEYFEL